MTGDNNNQKIYEKTQKLFLDKLHKENNQIKVSYQSLNEFQNGKDLKISFESFVSIISELNLLPNKTTGQSQDILKQLFWLHRDKFGLSYNKLKDIVRHILCQQSYQKLNSSRNLSKQKNTEVNSESNPVYQFDLRQHSQNKKKQLPKIDLQQVEQNKSEVIVKERLKLNQQRKKSYSEMSQQSEQQTKVIFFDWQELFNINLEDFEQSFGINFQLPQILFKKGKKLSKN